MLPTKAKKNETENINMIIERIRRRNSENRHDIDLLVRENRKLQAQNLSLSFKLTFETRKRKREETDESIIESMVDDGMDLLMSSFEE